MYLRLVHEELLPGNNQGEIGSASKFEPGVLRLVSLGGSRDGIQLRVTGGSRDDLHSPLPGAERGERNIVGAIATANVKPSRLLVGGIAAVVIVRGPLLDSELEPLESFLMRTMGAARSAVPRSPRFQSRSGTGGVAEVPLLPPGSSRASRW